MDDLVFERVPLMPIDGTRGWAHSIWMTIADRGTWMVPRSGLGYRKEEAERRMVLVERMPWMEGMPFTAEQLREDQDWENDGITKVFKAIGVEVVDESE